MPAGKYPRSLEHNRRVSEGLKRHWAAVPEGKRGHTKITRLRISRAVRNAIRGPNLSKRPE